MQLIAASLLVFLGVNIVVANVRRKPGEFLTPLFGGILVMAGLATWEFTRPYAWAGLLVDPTILGLPIGLLWLARRTWTEMWTRTVHRFHVDLVVARYYLLLRSDGTAQFVSYLPGHDDNLFDAWRWATRTSIGGMWREVPCGYAVTTGPGWSFTLVRKAGGYLLTTEPASLRQAEPCLERALFEELPRDGTD